MKEIADILGAMRLLLVLLFVSAALVQSSGGNHWAAAHMSARDSNIAGSSDGAGAANCGYTLYPVYDLGAMTHDIAFPRGLDPLDNIVVRLEGIGPRRGLDLASWPRDANCEMGTFIMKGNQYS